MIVSASYRTDIPALYADWFERRLDAGFCETVNPYNGKRSLLPLGPDEVDGFVFWTRRLGPFAGALARLRRRGTPFVVQHTVTGYPRALERATPDWRRAADEIGEAAARHGPRAVVWRYDPVIATDLTPAAFHEERVGRLAERLAGAVDEAVFSFAHIYARTRRNTDRAARAGGFGWTDPDDDARRGLLVRLAGIVGARGMRATLCAQPGLLAPPLEPAACIDAARLSDIAGRPVRARRKGNRPGCLCAEARDIGAYDTCPQGCVYCYANRSREAALRRFRAHDPARAALAPPPRLAAVQAGPEDLSPSGGSFPPPSSSPPSGGSAGSGAGGPLATPTMAARSTRSSMA